MSKKILFTVFIAIFSLIILVGYVRGDKGNPYYFQKENDTRVGGPFEASNSTSRYALTEAIVKDKSFFLSRQLAKFSSPDVVDYKGKFISIFTPGVSFLGIPFFYVGEIFGMPQLFTYMLNIIVAVINVYFVALLSKKFGTGYKLGIASGLIFLFATNGLAYSLTFTQHHVSTLLILAALLLAADKSSFKKNLLFGTIFGFGALVDIPNVFLLTPVALYLAWKSTYQENVNGKMQIAIRPALLAIVIGIIPFVALFAWYNHVTTGSYTKLGQTIGRSKFFRNVQDPRLSADSASTIKSDEIKPIGLKLPFETRAELQGMYILLLSNERSWLYYSPILLLGIFGFILVYKDQGKKEIGILAFSIVLVDIVAYSMFGDPWGGWAFGPRYLIPSAGLMAAFIGPALEKYKKNYFFMIIFSLLLFYSVWVNSLGALTTTAIPPKVEALNLASHIPYTYKYNQQLLASNFSGSLVYNIFARYKFTEVQYSYILQSMTLLMFVVLYITSVLRIKRK